MASESSGNEGAEPDAVPDNIIVLPPPANLVMFPLMSSGTEALVMSPSAPAQAQAAQAAQAAGVSASTRVDSPLSIPPALPAEAAATAAPAPAPAEAADPAAAIDVSALNLEPVRDRQRMAASLRLAMARLEEIEELPAPLPNATATSEPDASPIIPFPGPEMNSPGQNNIIRVQFGSSASAPNAELPNDSAIAAVEEKSASEGQLGTGTPLPAYRALTAINAGAASGSDATPTVERPFATAKALNSADPALRSEREGSSDPDGTSAAGKSRNMDSTSTIPAFGGSQSAVDSDDVELELTPDMPRLESTDRLSGAGWRASGETGSVIHPSGTSPSDSSRPVQAAGSVERIAGLVSRETSLFRQHGSDSMAVVLRPDANTELLVHLTRHNGQIEAMVRCERGDFQQLNALWSQLQEALGQQKVRLAPLEESTSDTSQFRQSGNSSPHTGNGREETGRQTPDEPHFMEEWPAPASPQQDPAHVRSRAGDLGRRHSTSRPGWETWA